MQTIRKHGKISLLLIFALITVAGYSQNTLNNYRFVILPQKFDFLSSQDEYGLNSAAKALLEQKGFAVFLTNGNIPQAIAANRCSALTADVTQRRALFSTNLTLLLKDCYGNVIYKGKEGRSWEKDFGVAYNEALKNAFTSLNAVPYKYDSTQSAQQQLAATTAGTAPVTAATPAAASPVTAPATTPTTLPAPTTAAAATMTASAAAPAPNATLYAQPIPNGYQLIDTTPKKVMTLLKTSLPDCYLVDTGAGTTSGIVFKKGTEWFLEYYKDGNLVSQKLTIKF